jgi:23S rRNA (cytosine1962-C5)-methyltransferase
LQDETGLSAVFERSDADVRELEGLPPRLGPIRGDPHSPVTITEHDLQFNVNIALRPQDRSLS